MKKLICLVLAIILSFEGSLIVMASNTISDDISIENRIVSDSEYINLVAAEENISYSEAERLIYENRKVARIDPETVVDIHRSVSKKVNKDFELQCSVYMEVVQDNMNHDYIDIKGARENNLKNIDIRIPRDKFVIMTGVSGSGKTSLAFDTVYAEGQRRYVESLSAYARQFLGNSEKPDVDSIEGLSPSISIDQKTTSNNPRSTVGTVTEIYDYLRLLYARVGIPYCPTHNEPITSQTIKQMVDRIMEIEDKT